MQIVTGRRGEPHVTSRQMQAVYRSFLGDFALLDIGEKLRAEAYSNDIVRVYDGVVSVQGIYAVIAYNQYDEVYIEPVSVGKKRIDTIVLHYTKDNTLDVEDMQLDVVQGEEYTDNPIAPVVPEGGDAWEGTTDIQVPIYDVEVTNFGLTVTPYSRMLTVIPTLESIAERIPETVVTGVKGDSEVLYRDGDVNITKANIGLGDVDNTSDLSKPISNATQTALNFKADLVYVDAKIAAAYHAGGNKTVAELTSALLIADNIGKVYNMSDSGVTTSDFVEGAGEPINEGDNVGICNVGTEESPVYKFDLLSGFVDLSAYYTKTESDNKYVDKVAGKGLSTEDYTTADKTKLAGISEGATQTIANPADTATETLSKVEIEGTVYDVPQGASGATELSELTDVNLSNVEDNDILQYDETANKWKNSNALQGAKTTTGNPINLTDAAPVNAVNLSMDLEPIQDLHGYDHPWVGGAGKNLYVGSPSFDGYSGTGWTKQTETYNGHDVYMKNSAWGGLYKLIDLPVGTYTFSCMVKTNDSANVYFYVNGNSATAGMSPSNSQVSTSTNWTKISLTFTVSVAGSVSLRVERSSSGNIYISEYQLEAGNQATSYADYENICPISGRSEVAIDRVGKNLFGGIKFANALHAKSDYGTIDTTNKTVSFNRTSNYSPIFEYPFKENTQYTFIYSGNTESVNQKNTSILFEYTDGTESAAVNLSSNIKGTYAIQSTNGKTIKSIDLRWANGANAVLYYDECGVFEGVLTVDDFEPYAGKTYTIQLGQTVYGGHLDVTKGKMVVDRGVVDLGTLNWTYHSESGNFYVDNAVGNRKATSNAICSCYEKNSNTYSVTELTSNGKFAFQENLLGRIIIRDTRYTDATTFKNVVTGQQLVYELATPYTIQLTPQQIKLLENTNTIYTDYEGDTITIEYQPNNAIGEAVRAAEESYDPEFAVRPPLKKIAFSGTTDSDGSVTLINASDIPSGHKIIPLHITDMTINGSAGTYFVEYKPYNSGDSVKGYCYTYHNGSQTTPVGTVVAGNFYYYELEV